MEISENDPPIVLTKQQLYDVFAGGEPGQIAMRNLIATMFSLTVGTGSDQPETWSGVVAGIGIAYSGSGLTFNSTSGSYRINGELYSARAQTITLTAADNTNPRIDTIYIDTSGTLNYLTGTAAANPSTPTVDPTTQLFLTSVLVPSGATDITAISSTNIYLENTEWTTSVTGTGFTAGSTANPYEGSKNVDGTSVAANATIKFANSSLISFDGEGNLSFRIAPKAQWNQNAQLTFQFFAGTVAKGVPISLTRNSYGFDSSAGAAYQLVVMPKADFKIPVGTSIDTLLIKKVGNPTIGFSLDKIILQNSDPSTVTGNPTESLIVAASDEATALTTGTAKIKFRFPYPFIIDDLRGSLTVAQASGSVLTVDVNESDTSILSTKLTFDNTETTTKTAATPRVISDGVIASDAEMSIDIDQVGDGTAKGLKLIFIGRRG